MPRHQTRFRARRVARQGGFNLIELMIVILIAAIGLAVAVPSFAEVIARNRISATSNEFIAAVMYARSEALQRNTITGICASEDKDECSGEWDSGWIVWADIDRDGVMGEGEVLRQGVVSPKDSFSGAVSAIEFGQRGLPMLGVPADGAQFVIEPKDCEEGKPFRRVLTVTATGQVRAGRGDENKCE